MRVNVYSDEFTGEFELVTNEEKAAASEGEFLDGVRLVTVSADSTAAESAVTIWVPVDGYEKMAESFDAMAEAVRGLAKQRSRN